ncbi:MAG TPA: hypothetical protein VFN94_09130 [Nitrospiria bacterium]|nr:hypothetical protein [Nitrospiria bacterium]
MGHLFQNRYRSIVCEEEPYLLALVRYIHLNPVRAGVVSGLKTLATYPWCGHGALLGRDQHPWQATAEVLARFGKTVEQARREYQTFMAAGIDSGEGRPSSSSENWNATNRSSYERVSAALPGAIARGVLGSPEFAETVRAGSDRRRGSSEADCRAVVLAVCRTLGLSPEALASGRRTRPLSNGRAVVAFVARTKYRVASSELAAALGTSPQAVLLAERRGAQLLKRRTDLKSSLKELRI